jgi:hypothetical protein
MALLQPGDEVVIAGLRSIYANRRDVLPRSPSHPIAEGIEPVAEPVGIVQEYAGMVSKPAGPDEGHVRVDVTVRRARVRMHFDHLPI